MKKILGAIISLIGFLIIFPCTAQGAEKEVNNITTYFQAQNFNVVEYPCVSSESIEETLKEVQKNKWYPLNLANWGEIGDLQQIELQFEGEEDIQNTEIFITAVPNDDDEVEIPMVTLNAENNFTVILEPPFPEQGYQWKWAQSTSIEENKKEENVEKIPEELNVTLTKKYKKFDLNSFCLVTALDTGDEISEDFLQKAINERMNFIILGNQSLAQKFNVSFEATSTLEEPSDLTLVNPNHFTYINDEKGIAQFWNCTNESFYDYPEESENALVKQWVCLREDAMLQKILFISPDFFLIPSAERVTILANSQTTGVQINGTNNQVSNNPQRIQFDFVTLTQGMTFFGVFIPLLSLGLVIFFLRNKLRHFIKEKPQKFTWSCMWVLLGFGLMMEVLYYIGITEIPLSLFKIYFGFYGISSLVLVVKGRPYLLAPFKDYAMGQYLQRNVEEITKWTGRLFVGSGIFWLYFFFFLKEEQWIPLIGIYLGALALLLTKPFLKIINEYKEPFEKIILWSLKALPIIFIGFWIGPMLFATLSDDYLFNWTASQWATAQEIALTDRGGNPLQAYYGSKDAEILSFQDALITLAPTNGSFPTQHVKVSMTLDAGQEMDLQLLNRNASREENTLFYIPRLNELSLIYHDEENEMSIYRYPNSKTFSASAEDTDFKTFVKNHNFEKNTIADLSLQQNGFLKTSFLEEGEKIPSENQTQWNIPLAGNQKYEFYTEVMDETFSLDLYIEKFPNSALGGEFLQVTLFDSSGNLIAQEQEEINYGFYDQIQAQTLSIKMDHLNPGLYEVVVEGVPGEVTYLTSNISVAYEINSMTVNSPFFILYSDEIYSAGAGALVTKTGTTSSEEFQTFEFGEGKGKINFDTEFLFSTSMENWRSPFLFQYTDHVTLTTEYVLVEDSVLKNIETEEKEGSLILSKIFDIGENTVLQWTLSPHNGEKQFWWKLKNITIEFL